MRSAKIIKTTVPKGALLENYPAADGHYTDAFAVTVPAQVSLPQFMQAFYTSGLFKVERGLLSVFAKAASTDQGAADLANGLSNSFAIWTVEDRRPAEILLREKSGHTRSWLMVRDGAGQTELLFGSALVSPDPSKTAPLFVRLMMPFHKLYSRLLLRSAMRNLSVG